MVEVEIRVGGDGKRSRVDKVDGKAARLMEKRWRIGSEARGEGGVGRFDRERFCLMERS